MTVMIDRQHIESCVRVSRVVVDFKVDYRDVAIEIRDINFLYISFLKYSTKTNRLNLIKSTALFEIMIQNLIRLTARLRQTQQD